MRILAVLALGWGLILAGPAAPHDIYSGLTGPRGGSCCNGSSDGHTGDCAPTLARAERNDIAYLAEGKTWVHVPIARVMFMNLPGEEKQVLPPAPEGMVWAHLCSIKSPAAEAIDGYYVFCALYPPSGM